MTRRKSQPDDSTTEPLEDVTESEEAIAPKPFLQPSGDRITALPMPPEVFEFVRGRCPVCSEKISTNLEGRLFCPVKNKECPRNVSTIEPNS